MKNIYFIPAILILVSCANNEKNSKSIDSEEPQTDKTTEVEEQVTNVSKKTYELGNIQVELTQTKSDGESFYCKAKIVTIKGKNFIDSISFIPEPVGGHYGISKPNRIENHLVFTKHGDYDGRTLIVNDQGKILDLIGGEHFFDPQSKLLFTIYDSDLSGFAAFDITSDSIILEMPEIEDRPISFHKMFGEKYFILSSKDESLENDKSIWEIEFEIERIVQVDPETIQINESNILKTWTREDVNCECEK